jgi:hypothetical protein
VATLPKFVRDFLLNVGGLNSGDLDSARKVVGGTSKGLGMDIARTKKAYRRGADPAWS